MVAELILAIGNEPSDLSSEQMFWDASLNRLRKLSRNFLLKLATSLERVDIQDSHGLANLIQAPFRTGALNVGGSAVFTG